jgi:hypothetical protein
MLNKMPNSNFVGLAFSDQKSSHYLRTFREAIAMLRLRNSWVHACGLVFRESNAKDIFIYWPPIIKAALSPNKSMVITDIKLYEGSLHPIDDNSVRARRDLLLSKTCLDRTKYMVKLGINYR